MGPLGHGIPLPGLRRPSRLEHWAPRCSDPDDIETVLGKPVNLTLSADHGSPPYTWSIAGRPAGPVGNSFGQITGTPVPTGAGTSQVTATVRRRFVVSQHPGPGAHLPLGTAVNVMISSGKAKHGHPATCNRAA